MSIFSNIRNAVKRAAKAVTNVFRPKRTTPPPEPKFEPLNPSGERLVSNIPENPLEVNYEDMRLHARENLHTTIEYEERMKQRHATIQRLNELHDEVKNRIRDIMFNGLVSDTYNQMQDSINDMLADVPVDASDETLYSLLSAYENFLSGDTDLESAKRTTDRMEETIRQVYNDSEPTPSTPRYLQPDVNWESYDEEQFERLKSRVYENYRILTSIPYYESLIYDAGVMDSDTAIAMMFDFEVQGRDSLQSMMETLDNIAKERGFEHERRYTADEERYNYRDRYAERQRARYARQGFKSYGV